MSDDSNTIGGTNFLDALGTPQINAGLKKSNEQIGKEEFLQMLVTQLKNQDPLNPLDNDQFAVNLAQFSQLEQLISINQTLKGSEGQGDLSSLASYLGTEVTLNSSVVQVKDHDGGRIRINVPSAANGVKVELLNADGSVAESHDLGPMNPGSYSISLAGLDTANGEFAVRVSANGADGQSQQIEGFTAGIVTGFVPGPDAVLIMGDQRVSPSDIREVNLVAS